MTSILWLVFLAAGTNADLYFTVGSIKSSWIYGSQNFIDCSSRKFHDDCTWRVGSSLCYSSESCSTKLSTPVTASAVSVTAAARRNMSITTASHQLPFENYWYSSYGYQPQTSQQESFQNNGTVNPEFYGLDPSAKTICSSVEAADYPLYG